MWTDGNGNFYIGDCRAGERATTEEEVAAYETGKAAPAPDPLAVLQNALLAKGVIGEADLTQAAATLSVQK